MKTERKKESHGEEEKRYEKEIKQNDIQKNRF